MPRSVITGEAVSLDLPAASLITRGISLAVDLVLYVGLLLLMGLGFGLFGAQFVQSEAGVIALALAAVLVCLVIVPVTVETLSRGRSVGKLIFGIRVVRIDGGTIRYRHALIRTLVGVGEFFSTLGLVPLVTAAWTSRTQRLGDLAAGTYGIRTRHRQVRPMMLPVPAMMTSWSQIADIGRIPDDLAARVARLLRTMEYGGTARNMRILELTAQALSNQVQGYVSPPAPPSSPVQFLSAVMAERRNRSHRRMKTQQDRQQNLHRRLATMPYD